MCLFKLFGRTLKPDGCRTSQYQEERCCSMLSGHGLFLFRVSVLIFDSNYDITNSYENGLLIPNDYILISMRCTKHSTVCSMPAYTSCSSTPRDVSLRVTKFHHPFIGGITKFRVSKMGGSQMTTLVKKTQLCRFSCYVTPIFNNSVISSEIVDALKSSEFLRLCRLA